MINGTAFGRVFLFLIFSFCLFVSRCSACYGSPQRDSGFEALCARYVTQGFRLITGDALGNFEVDLKQLSDPPENLRARELDEHNVKKVKEELEVKGEVGAVLQMICVVPPVCSFNHSNLF